MYFLSQVASLYTVAGLPIPPYLDSSLSFQSLFPLLEPSCHSITPSTQEQESFLPRASEDAQFSPPSEPSPPTQVPSLAPDPRLKAFKFPFAAAAVSATILLQRLKERQAGKTGNQGMMKLNDEEGGRIGAPFTATKEDAVQRKRR